MPDVLFVYVDVPAGLQIKNHHRVEILIEQLTQRRFAFTQARFRLGRLGDNPIALRYFLFEASLHLVAGSDLLGQFCPDRFDFVLGGLALG